VAGIRANDEIINAARQMINQQADGLLEGRLQGGAFSLKSAGSGDRRVPGVESISNFSSRLFRSAAFGGQLFVIV
jgi:hypothetical protein